jgi:hypothetical protein
VSCPAAIGPRNTPASWRPETATMHLMRSGAPSLFDSREQAEFPRGRPRTADSLVAPPATRAGVLVMPEGDLVGRRAGR